MQIRIGSGLKPSQTGLKIRSSVRACAVTTNHNQRLR
jgi:hypothetical protein